MKKNSLLAVFIAAAAAVFQFYTDSLVANNDGRCEVIRFDPIQGWFANLPLPDCQEVIRTSRSFGKFQRYGRFDGHVFSFSDMRKQAGRIEMAEVEGVVDLDRLRPYLGGAYTSDGAVVLHGWQRVPSSTPAVNVGRMHWIDSSRKAATGYVTDGRWVLYRHQIIENADPATFKPLSPPPGSDRERDRFGGEKDSVEFGRDARNVYFGAQQLSGADPASFKLVYVGIHRDETLHPGFWAYDSSKIWRVFSGISEIDTSQDPLIRPRLLEYRADLHERYSFLRFLPLPALALTLICLVVFIRRAQRRIRSRYQASLVTRPCIGVAAAFLFLPSVFYALFFSRCHAPEDTVIYGFIVFAVGAASLLFSVVNGASMDWHSAASATIVQIGIVSVTLLVGIIPQ